MEEEQSTIILDDSTSTSSKSIKSSKKNLGRKFSKVWEHFIQGKEHSTRGHYEGTCKYCNKFWTDARPNILRAHLASHCSKCPNNVSLEFARIVAQDLVQ
ncbi:19861_t:CDS:1, partial [Funneliformis geosporum]